jgi:hypothetical protein
VEETEGGVMKDFRNYLTWYQRVMARFLRKRGWVVFYLEERSRVCNEGTCWMKLYQSSLESEDKP